MDQVPVITPASFRSATFHQCVNSAKRLLDETKDNLSANLFLQGGDELANKLTLFIAGMEVFANQENVSRKRSLKEEHTDGESKSAKKSKKRKLKDHKSH